MAQDIRSQIGPEKYTLATQLVEAVRAALLAEPWEPLDTSSNPLKLFDFGLDGTLEDIPARKTPAFALEVGDTTVDSGINFIVEKTMRLYVHVKVINTLGVDPRPLLDYYFARISKALVTPEHFANIAYDLGEAGNSPQYLGPDDPEPGGTIYFDIDYRHGTGNHFSENIA